MSHVTFKHIFLRVNDIIPTPPSRVEQNNMRIGRVVSVVLVQFPVNLKRKINRC